MAITVAKKATVSYIPSLMKSRVDENLHAILKTCPAKKNAQKQTALTGNTEKTSASSADKSKSYSINHTARYVKYIIIKSIINNTIGEVKRIVAFFLLFIKNLPLPINLLHQYNYFISFSGQSQGCALNLLNF